MLKLSSLKPQIVNIRIMGYGEPVEVAVMPLSYIQWQNATIGIVPPQAEKKRILVDKNQPPVDTLDYNDLEFQRKRLNYENEIRMRRVAIALAGAGEMEVEKADGSIIKFTELNFDEQVEEVRQMDAGITNAIYIQLEGMATKRVGGYFRPNTDRGLQPSSNGDANLQANAVDSGTVGKADGD